MRCTIISVFLLLAFPVIPAWAQEQCITGAVDCAKIPDDPICMVQKQFGLAQTGECNRATAGALIGDGFQRYYQYRGVFPTDAEQNAFAICSRTSPVRKDGKCGWYRFEQAKAAASGGKSAGDLVSGVVDQRRSNEKAVESTRAAHEKALAKQQGFLDQIAAAAGLGTLRDIDLFVGPAVGGTDFGGDGYSFVGGELALHFGRRGGLEGFISGGHGGKVDDKTVGQLNAGARLAVMPLVYNAALLIGYRFEHRFVPLLFDSNFHGGEVGVRWLIQQWVAVEGTLHVGQVSVTPGEEDDKLGLGGIFKTLLRF